MSKKKIRKPSLENRLENLFAELEQANAPTETLTRGMDTKPASGQVHEPVLAVLNHPEPTGKLQPDLRPVSNPAKSDPGAPAQGYLAEGNSVRPAWNFLTQAGQESLRRGRLVVQNAGPQNPAVMALALPFQGQADLLLEILDEDPHRQWSEEERLLVEQVADQLTLALENAYLFEQTQKAVEEMRELDRLKSQFLANMSHELRTPLNSIIGFSRVILKGIDGPVTDLQQQDLSAIHNSGQHLLGLINDVLDLSKIEAGKMELQFDDEVNLGEMIHGVMSTTVGLVKDKPVKLLKIVPPDLPTVRADPMKIRQVFINFLSNAAKFTDQGSITVEAALQNRPDGGREVILKVTDTGPGISKADQEKLFKAFSQVDGSLTRRTTGTGLGLSICQALVTMHGGRIGVDSEVGRGSTFYFTLPLASPDTEAVPNRTVLVFDDPQLRKL